VGDLAVVVFGLLGLAALVLLGLGSARRSRTLTVAGAALLVALAGAWVFGPLGAATGLVALTFLKRPRTEPS